ncbi:hypothetical protein Btru_019821 [Bulinus truncatus]|nr:hypothetical protein Btru_019821 [Bulinus truncatus]
MYQYWCTEQCTIMPAAVLIKLIHLDDLYPPAPVVSLYSCTRHVKSYDLLCFMALSQVMNEEANDERDEKKKEGSYSSSLAQQLGLVSSVHVIDP